MTKLYLAIVFSFLLTSSFAQRLVQITIDNHGNSNIITFLVDETVMVNITKDGKIIDWGIEYNPYSRSMYPGILQKYMGREEYYPSTADSAYHEKIKFIGRTSFTYYSSDENEAFKGKIKTIGSNIFDYYPAYENAAFKGNIKNAGPLSFTYYSSFDELYKGKIKSIGSTNFTYYGLIDDKAYRGKIKNIGSSIFTYYSSYDRREYSGSIKSGSPTIYSSGIKYFIRN
ncbi:MAG: leucine-rich repeat protein [Ginsengibacter sp.]